MISDARVCINYNLKMGRVIFRTIVSSPHEALFVYLNWLELGEVVDVFAITEADVTHTGQHRDFVFEKFTSPDMNSSPKVKYLPCIIDTQKLETSRNPESFHSNEQLIRNAFAEELKLQENDIVISCDADEVLFKKRIAFLVWKVRIGKIFAESYCLRLHQIIYRFKYNWIDCDFRGPTVSRASYFIKKEKPQWRYEGRFTLKKSGTHFSWVMPIEDMLKKIHNYAHSSEYEHLANIESLRRMVKDLKYPFEPNRKFTIVKQKNLRSSIYPASLRKLESLISQDLLE